MEVLQMEDLAPMLERVKNLETQFLAADQRQVNFPFFSNEALSSHFGVSTRTLATWRNSGKLGFCQLGRTIIYRKEDVDLFLRKHYHEPFILKKNLEKVNHRANKKSNEF